MSTESSSRTRGRRFASLVLLAGLLVGAVVGLALGVRTAGTYTARATVLVSPLEGNPYSPRGNGEDLVNLETEAQLASSVAVADVVAKDVGAPGVGRLLDGLEVEVPSNTQIVEITYRTHPEAVAVRRAQSFATAYLAFRVDRANDVVAGRVAVITDQIDAQTARKRSLQNRRAATESPTQRSSLQAEIEGIDKQVAQLRTALVGARFINADAGQVISPALIVSRSPWATRGIFTAAGALAGLAAAALILLSRARPTGSYQSVPEPVAFADPSPPVERPSVQQPQNV